MPETITLGKSEMRKDAWDKVTGAAEYVADLSLDGILYGAIVRSSVHHGRILSIDTTASQAAPGVVRVLTAADIPGEQKFGALIPDQPALADAVASRVIAAVRDLSPVDAIRQRGRA